MPPQRGVNEYRREPGVASRAPAVAITRVDCRTMHLLAGTPVVSARSDLEARAD